MKVVGRWELGYEDAIKGALQVAFACDDWLQTSKPMLSQLYCMIVAIAGWFGEGFGIVTIDAAGR